MGKATGWVLKTILAVVIGFNTLQGIISPVIDSLKSTAFSRVAEMIPGIGNIAGSVTDVLLGSAVLIKNGIGAVALIVILLLCGGRRWNQAFVPGGFYGGHSFYHHDCSRDCVCPGQHIMGNHIIW